MDTAFTNSWGIAMKYLAEKDRYMECDNCDLPLKECSCKCEYCGKRDSCECALFDAATGG